jgi:ElaB/YqjD/DUF883 family membrane-anchored ribosome-binding protein
MEDEIIDPNNPVSSLATAAASMLPADAQNKLVGDAGEIANTAKEAVSSIKDEAGDQLARLKDQAGEQLTEFTDKAKSFATDQKDVAGDQLGNVAQAISKVANELQGQPVIAGYATDLAGGIKRVAETMKNHNVDELLAMAEDFGRTQPVAFLGAGALAGFVASRFVLSSSHRRQSSGNGASPSSSPSSGLEAPMGGRSDLPASGTVGDRTGGF